METNSPQKRTARVSGCDANGKKTTVSMPPEVRAAFVEAFGGEEEFRHAFNLAFRFAQPRPGYSLSLVVRMYLEDLVARKNKTRARAAAKAAKEAA